MDYFNETERKKQRQFAQKRDEILSPIIKLCVRLGISKNAASFIGVAFLLLASLIHPNHYVFISIFLAFYLFFDALDGGIARYTKSYNENGSVIDIICDQLGVVLLSAALIYYYPVDDLVVFIFSHSYIAFIILVVYLNQQKIPLIPFIRTKYLFFILYAFSSFLNMTIINTIVGIFAVYYVLMFIVLMYFLSKHSSKTSP